MAVAERQAYAAAHGDVNAEQLLKNHQKVKQTRECYNLTFILLLISAPEWTFFGLLLTYFVGMYDFGLPKNKDGQMAAATMCHFSPHRFI